MTRAAVIVYRDLLRATRTAFTSDANMLTHSRLELRTNFDVRGGLVPSRGSSCPPLPVPHPFIPWSVIVRSTGPQGLGPSPRPPTGAGVLRMAG